MSLEAVVQENTFKLREITGPAGSYMNSEIAQTLIAYYRINYPTAQINDLFGKILDGKYFSELDGLESIEHVIGFVGSMFGVDHPDNPKLAEFTGTPVAGTIYLAIIKVKAEIMERKYTKYLANGDTIFYETEFDRDESGVYPNNMLALYEVGAGFTVLGESLPISSVAMNDIAEYKLISKGE